MNVILPSFPRPYLRVVSLCADFHADETAGFAQDLPVAVTTPYCVDGVTVVARLLLESADADADTYRHFHCDLFRDESPLVGDMDEVSNVAYQDQLAELNGQHVDLYLVGTFRVPIDCLPRHGMISSMLGVWTKSCGAELDLQGANFAINGDQFTRLSWQVDDEEDAVEAKIHAELADVAISENYLADQVDLLQSGLEWFILESAERDSDDTTAMPDADAQAEA